MKRTVKDQLLRFGKVIGLSTALVMMGMNIWLFAHLTLKQPILLVPDFVNWIELILCIVALGCIQHFWAVECGFDKVEDKFFAWIKKKIGWK